MQPIIDLNYHPKKKEEPKQEEPALGIQLLLLTPFALLLWKVILTGFIGPF